MQRIMLLINGGLMNCIIFRNIECTKLKRSLDKAVFFCTSLQMILRYVVYRINSVCYKQQRENSILRRFLAIDQN